MIVIPYLTALTTYFSYGLLFIFGQVRDFFRKIIDWWSASNLQDLNISIFASFIFEFRTVSIGLLQVLLMLGLMWLNATPMTTTKHSS
ncbi:hypothetical protein ACFX10_032869 [Malus domestica]